MGFSKKSDFVEIAKIKDFFGGCNWNSKTSQNVQKLVLIKKNKCVFRKKICDFFEKSLKLVKLLSNATELLGILKTLKI